MTYDPKLLEFATTDRQREIYGDLLMTNSLRKTAANFSVNKNSVAQIVGALTRKAAARNYAPENDATHPTAPGFLSNGNSTLYDFREDPNGEKLLQWVKTKPDLALQWEAIEQAISDLTLTIPARAQAPLLGEIDKDLVVLYPEGDPHWGMRVWAPEADVDYDLSIAFEEYQHAVDYLVSTASPAAVGVCLNIGDNFHSDNPENVTRKSKNPLQVDGRLAKVYETVVKARAYKIDQMLTKHERVISVEIPGNHDEVLTMAFRATMHAYYRDLENVEIADTRSGFWYGRFGKLLFGAVHGDKVRFEQLPILMATDVPKLWGATKFRTFFTGHQHHLRTGVARTRQDEIGCLVEMLRTLAPRNEYEHSHGYRAPREMFARTYHVKHGELFTNHISGDAIHYLTGNKGHADY